MNNKTLLIILAVFVGAIALIGIKLTNSNGNTLGSGAENNSISLTTDPNPLKMGPATFIIDVKDKDGKPVENAKVSFDLNMTAMNMGTQKGNATFVGDGRYSAAGKMSMKGPWRVKTKVAMPDGSVENKDFTVNVP